MQTHKFLTEVETNLGTGAQQDASRVTQAVLGILGTLDLQGELKDAAAQLPQEIQSLLTTASTTRTLSEEDFVEEVASELGLDTDGAERAASAVLKTLRRALSEGEYVDLALALPSGFQRFLETK